MSFELPARSFGIYEPQDVSLIRIVLQRLLDDGLVPVDDRDSFSRYMLSMYARDICGKDTLLGLCRAAAKARYQTSLEDAAE